MTVQRKYDPTRKDQVFNTLRRETLAARLKITLDEKLGEQTSETVKKLASMTLPPRIRGNRDDAELPGSRTYDRSRKDQVSGTLRLEILAARLKITVDAKLGEHTSETVKKLANMTLPPLVRQQ